MFGSAFTTCFLSPPNLQESKSFTIIWHFGATWNMRTCGFSSRKTHRQLYFHSTVIIAECCDTCSRTMRVHSECMLSIKRRCMCEMVRWSDMWIWVRCDYSLTSQPALELILYIFKLCQSQWCCQIGQKCMICQKYWSPSGVYWRKFRLLCANTYNSMLSNILFNISKYYIWLLYLNTLFMLGSCLLRPIKLMFLTYDHASFMFTL